MTRTKRQIKHLCSLWVFYRHNKVFFVVYWSPNVRVSCDEGLRLWYFHFIRLSVQLRTNSFIHLFILNQATWPIDSSNTIKSEFNTVIKLSHGSTNYEAARCRQLYSQGVCSVRRRSTLHLHLYMCLSFVCAWHAFNRGNLLITYLLTYLPRPLAEIYYFCMDSPSERLLRSKSASMLYHTLRHFWRLTGGAFYRLD